MIKRPNYTIGAGRVYLAYNGDPAFGERYLGSSPGFSLGLNVETLTVYKSVGGVVMPDAVEVLRVEGSCALSLDNITRDNLLMFMMSSRAETQVSSGPHTKTIRLVPGNQYDLGVKALRSLTATSVGAPFDLSKFDIDGAVGLIRVREDADIYVGQEVSLEYLGDGVSYLESGGPVNPYKGPLRYVEDNTAGENRVLLIPSLALLPDSELDLKVSAWRTLVMRAEVTSVPLWIDRSPQDDYDVAGPDIEDFGNLSVSVPQFTDDYGVHDNG